MSDSDDLMLLCCDCEHEFVWTGGEQFYYKSLNLAQPKRCPPCRAARKALINPQNRNNGVHRNGKV